ncbi:MULTISPECIES: hypothetical protein [Paraburkholderia]|uniref:hypothetical protein n=1 Tax=Paraburkholderia TaxID=1822464 RepID=UPI002258DB92|nr:MULTISPECIES: hypothetical protein [Paraburkholderia]MCX4177456.1 hypothetical protein [Paraburkholderia madseniana]MDQ6465445.1 hypothetical protein [Paraburkholderia madseniana]
MTLDARSDAYQSAPHDSARIRTTVWRDTFEMLALSTGLWLALLLPTMVGSADVTPARAIAIFLIATLSIVSGRAIRVCIRLPKEPGFAAAFEVVIGFCASSLLHLTTTALFRLTADLALLVDIAVVAAFFLVSQKRERVAQRSGVAVSAEPARNGRTVLVDVAMLIAISALVTVWTRDALAAVREAHASGVLRVWSDFLLQAAEIKYLESYPAFHGQSLFLAGSPQPIYHRASYALSAIYASIAHEPILDTATYFWMPTGIVLLGMGAYGLGCALGGRIAGVVSALALFLLPDASMYGLHNGYFAFHWLIQVAPGSGYALALALIGLALYVRGVLDSSGRLIVIGAAPVLASAVFRVHIAIPAVATFIVMMLLAWQPKRPWHRLATVALLLVAAAGAAVVSEHVALAPHFLTAQRDGLRYIDAVHAATPIAYEGLYAKWTTGDTDLQKGAIGYALLLVAELGALLPLLLIYVFQQIRSTSGRWQIYVVPLVLLCVHCAITFLMPTASNGDITEWSHRSFVLVYAVLLIYIVAWATSLLAAAGARNSHVRSLTLAGSILLVSGAIVPWHFGKNAQYGSLRDGPTACATAISDDMFKTTDFIRAHADRGDKLLMSNNDPLALGVALTGLAEFVSREPLYRALGGSVAAMAASRVAENGQLSGIENFDELKAFGRKTGVRWYLLQQGDMPRWPAPLLDRAAFVSGNMRVFDLQR